VIVAFGGAKPRMTISVAVVVVPSGGSTMRRPCCGAAVGVGAGVGVGDGVGLGVGVGEGVEVGVGEGVGLGVGVGDGVGLGVGAGEGVGVGGEVGVGCGDSWTKTGSDDSGDGLAVAASATVAPRPPKTLTTTSSAMTVSPATNPPSSQSRRGCVRSERRERPPWTTPL
jgi:hypothetical protein